LTISSTPSGISRRTRSSSTSPSLSKRRSMPARASPGTTVRLVSSGVPAIIQVTLAAGISSCSAISARMRSEAGARTEPISEEWTSTPSPARSSSSCRPLQPATTGAVPSSPSCMSKSSAQSARSASRCCSQNRASRGLPSSSSPSMSSTWRHGLSAPAKASRLPARAALELAAPRA
jgi:hypothetical protein